MATKKPAALKIPNNPAALLDAYYTARQIRLDADRQIKPLQEAEQGYKKALDKMLVDKGLEGVAGKLATCERVKKRYPQLNDLEALKAYAKRKGNEDLITVGMNSAAVVERWNDNVEVPGVGFYEVDTISIHKRKEQV